MNHSVSSKEEIIAICKKLVQKEGLSAVTIRQVADQCEISIGTVYNYFPSKERLVLATIEAIWKEILYLPSLHFDGQPFSQYVDSLIETIQQGCSRYPNFFKEHRLALPASLSSEGSKKMEQHFAYLKASLLNVLEHDKEIRADVFNEDLTPHHYIDYLFHLILYTLSEEKTTDPLLKLIKNSLY